MIDSCSTNSDSSVELNSILDGYIAQFRAGTAPSIEHFAHQHPRQESELLELLPAMVFAEQLNVRQATASDAVLPERTMVGPFVLVREIGRGGMGIVYEATNQLSQQSFALKLLHPRFARSSALRSRFAREAEAAAKLHHPHIVPAKYFGSDEHHHYLVMQLIDGVSLDRLMSTEACSEDELNGVYRGITQNWQRVAELGAQVCSALAHSHERGLIHRDIKPANLLLDRKGCIWVTDFGLAKVYEDDSQLTRKGEVLGTPRYMSPEQVFGIADVRSDVYCLGLTLYELILAGQGKSEEWLKLQQENNYVLELPELRRICDAVPKSLSKIVMKACAHHPAKRFQSAREFEFCLNQFRFDGGFDRRTSRRSNRSSKPWLWSAGFAVAGIASLYLPRPVREPPTNGMTVNDTSANSVLPDPKNFIPPNENCITFHEPNSDITNVWVAVNRREDDVEQYPENGQNIMYIDSGDLELTWDEVDQLVGIRFSGVQVPRDARIESAVLAFWSAQSERIETNLRIYAIDEDDAAQFTPVDNHLSGRQRTAEFVEWSVPPWDRGNNYESPSVQSLIQQRVDHPAWKAGNAIAFLIDGTGKRVATAYDGNIHYGPMLKIRYSLPKQSDADVSSGAALAEHVATP